MTVKVAVGNKGMETTKVIDLEEALRKREVPLIKKYSWEEDFVKVDKIIQRRIWREEKRHARLEQILPYLN